MSDHEQHIETGLEIAVIGTATRFPGAEDTNTFWENLKNGVESLAFFTDEELLEAGVEAELLKHPNFVKARGGVLEDIETFDAGFFNYTPLEAEHMAPSIRLFHQCLWTALEDAGYPPGTAPGLTGLYAGLPPSDEWEQLSIQSGDGEQSVLASNFLNNRDFIGTLISYKLNLTGPSFVMTTACSTSLAAVHLAYQGLLSGDCDIALAGGVSFRINEDYGYIYNEGGIRSPDGHCRAFDAQSGGTVGGDGAGVVVLKRLDDALKHRDHIYAVIRGSAVNNDGSRKVGYTAPSVEGQAQVIRKAMRMAETPPDSISYVETHGTGTPLGDVTEMEALSIAFNTPKKQFCAIGSAKTNIGHLGAAAGAAGLIKTALALKHRQIPPSLHFSEPNPRIDFQNSPFYVNQGLTEWPSSHAPRRAGVSSFGIGGTNVHVVLQEAPQLENTTAPTTGGTAAPHLLLLSAVTQPALDRMTQNLANHLETNPDLNLTDAAFTLQTGRKRFPFRRKLVCSDTGEAVERLTGSASRGMQTTHAKPGEEERPVIFLFPGLGPQYPGMGEGLYRDYPVFRETMDRCFGILTPLLGYDIKEQFYPPAGTKAEKTYTFDTAQLFIFLFEYALARLLMSWGIRPHAMIGYSFGEYTAACLSGVFSLEDMLRLLVIRGRLISRLAPGMMLGVPQSAGETGPLLPPSLSVAIDNGSSCVVSGPAEAVLEFSQAMKARRLICTPLEASHAIHSPMMDPLLKVLETEVARVTLNPPQIPYISTVSGDWIKIDDARSPAYWARQMREPVRFAGGLKKLFRQSPAIFLEAGPGRDISTLVQRELEKGDIEKNSSHRTVNLVRPRAGKADIHDTVYLADKIGLLWMYGAHIDWQAYHNPVKPYRIPLPAYSFEKQRFWKLPENRQEAAPPTTTAAGQQGPAAMEERDLEESFYMPAWKQTPLPPIPRQPAVSANGGWLFFLDHETTGLGAAMIKRLRELDENVPIITVTPGGRFSRPNENEFTLNPSQVEDYEALAAHLAQNPPLPGTMVHLWSFYPPSPRDSVHPSGKEFFRQCRETGYDSLLYLGRALAKHGIARRLGEIDADSQRVRIQVVVHDTCSITGEGTVLPEKISILGPCRTIPQEYPNITCRNTDVPLPTPGTVESVAAMLLAESLAPAEDGLIAAAYRGRSRWVQQVEPITLPAPDTAALPLREGGVYLITGGLGDDSFARARFLAETYKARLALTGRTQIPERHYWSQHKMLDGADDPVVKKIARIKELEQLGAEVLPLCADVSNLLDMMQVMRDIDHRFGELHGVIHAAGVTGIESSRLLADLGAEESDWHFRPKVYGLYCLDKVLEGRALDFRLLTSSIASLTGGAGLTHYTAAGLFMDAFAQGKNHQDPSNGWIGLNWQGTSPEETVEAFKRVLAYPAGGQIFFSKTDLPTLVKERLTPQPAPDTGVEAEDTGGESAFLYTRPELSTPYEEPRNALEERLAVIWQRFFGIEKIGITDDIFDLGGDSLKAVNILSILHKELDVEIPVKIFFDHPTIAGIAAFLDQQEETGGTDSKKKQTFSAVPPAEEKEYYTISSAQKRMYIFQHMNPETTAYNSPLLKIVEGGLRPEGLEEIFKTLIRRHESLRTSIITVDDEPLQKVHAPEEVEFNIRRFDSIPMPSPSTDPNGPAYTSANFGEPVKQFVQPFQLSRPPLMRVGLLPLGDTPGHYLLMMDMHHIISDGISMAVLMDELMALYQEKTLPPPALQYKDYAQWQARAAGKDAASQEAFWLKEFEGEVPVLQLPLDHPRPRVQQFAGKVFSFDLDAQETRALSAIARKQDATLFMLLLSIYYMFLARLTNQETIVVGTPTAGRYHADLERVVGMFVNTLALKLEPRGDKSAAQFVSEVKNKTLEAFANQDFQYEELVEKAVLNRDSSRNPLFDTMFLLLNMEMPVLEIPGLTLTTVDHERDTAKFDLTLVCMEAQDRLSCMLEYATPLLEDATVQRFGVYLKAVITAVIADPQQHIGDIEILPQEEKHRLLIEFNDTAGDFPANKSICHLLRDMAEKFPHTPALVSNHAWVTFRHMDQITDHWASLLQTHHALTPGNRAAIVMERSIELIMTLIAVMKTNAAYVPLSPTLPPERLKLIMNDASIDILITDEFARAHLPPAALRGPLRGERQGAAPPGPPIGVSRERRFEVDAGSLAYIMYTSGSTGVPKGVPVEHRTIVNTLWWRKEYYEYRPGDVSLQIPPYFFDSSVTDIFTPLIGGARLVLVTDQQRTDLHALARIIPDYGITHFIAVPTFYNAMVEEIPEALHRVRMITVAGEHFPAPLVQKHFEKLPGVRIFNEYGPTENSVNSTAYELKPHSRKALIGRPITNVQTYILDRMLHLCPTGVTGEICLAGSSLARGYLNRPELTDEKFVTWDANEPTPVGGNARIYRTGDLGRWLPCGNLEFVGRVDSQVKIRGIRVEPGEIENRLMRYPDVKNAVVLAHRGSDGESFLCAYVVPQAAGTEPKGVREFLAGQVPDYMVPQHFLFLEAIPLLPSGKINRAALPEPQLSARDITPPRNPLEQALVRIWTEILNLEAEHIGIDNDFFQLGGHSLKATRLTARIHKELQVKLPLTEVFTQPTIRALAAVIEASPRFRFAGLQPLEEKEYYPLSSPQKRLYLQQQIDPNSTAYNMPALYRLTGEPDPVRFETVFQQITQRHEALRTAFITVKGEAVQCILPEVRNPFTIPHPQPPGEEYALDDIPALFSRLVKPFYLDQAPLLRVELIYTAPGEYLLFMDIHHIISDGTSSEILVNDFINLYQDQAPPLPRIQYKDYASWQNQRLTGSALRAHESYWFGRLKGFRPTRFPIDRLDSYNRTEGKVLFRHIEPQPYQKIKHLCAQHQVTAFTFLLTLFQSLLARELDQEDITIGIPASIREHADLGNVIGIFLNVLPIRSHIDRNQTFAHHLAQNKTTMLEALRHQDYPYEILAEELRQANNLDNNEIFTILFNYFPTQVNKPATFNDFQIEALETRDITPKYDITLYAQDTGETLELILVYKSNLYYPETVACLLEDFAYMLEAVTENENITLNQISAPPAVEEDTDDEFDKFYE